MTRLDLHIYRGITFGPLVISAKDVSAVAVNLTGWSVFAEVRGGPCGVLAFDLEPAITTAATGEITISLTDEETDELADGNFRWDLILEKPTGERIGPFIGGDIRVTTPITQTE